MAQLAAGKRAKSRRDLVKWPVLDIVVAFLAGAFVTHVMDLRNNPLHLRDRALNPVESPASNEPSPLLHWNSLPNKRSVFIMFLSADILHKVKFWSDQELFLSKQRNVTLLLSCPHSDTTAIRNFFTEQHNWELQGEYVHPHEFVFRQRMHRYLTPKGIEVLFQPIIAHLPSYYLQARPPLVPSCAGHVWPISYALYSGAVFSYHLPRLPVIQKFDYLIQMDIDTAPKSDFNVDIGEDMAEKACLVMHTGARTTSDCEAGNYAALLRASIDLNLGQPKSGGYDWCNRDLNNSATRYAFEGNFLGFATSLIRQPDVLRVSEYFYESHQPGYFTHRWGDQGAQILYVCQMLDVLDIKKPDPQVCDYEKYRVKYFSHHGGGW